MRKILFIGSGPLPIEKNTIGTAFGLRTWQFLKPLLKQKNIDIHIVLLSFPDKYPQDHPLRTKGYYELSAQDLYINIEEEHTRKKFQIFAKNHRKLPKLLQQIHDQIQPDVLVGINIHPAFIASKLKRTCPFWADLNGWTMAEAQAQATLWQSNEMIPRLWRMEKSVLQTLDRCSAVSLPQKYATIGELAAVGRLNQWTHTHSFVEVIENAMDESLPEFSAEKTELDQSLLKEIGYKYKEDQQIVLSIGAFNTWIDAKTLLKGLELAMEKDKNIIFVNTGEGVPGLSQKKYEQFKSACSKSRFSHRLKHVGWVSRSQLNTLLKVAKIGINIDLPIYETFLGARNRINEYLIWNLPILTTKGSAIANTLIDAKAAIGVETQNAEELASKLQYFLHPQHQEQLEDIRKKAEYYKKNIYSIEQTTKPFIEWLSNPFHAPDFNQKRFDMEHRNFLRQALLYIRRNGIKSIQQKLFKSNSKP